MKIKNLILSAVLGLSIVLSSCASMSNTSKGAIYGGVGGAAVGAGVGALAGGGKGAAIGAAIGAGVGAGAGALIGRKMDKQKAELQAIKDAQVEEVTDVNNLKALKITFASGILFETGKSALSASSKTALTEFANSVKGNPQTDIAIHGHSDITGTVEANNALSLKRAASVNDYLKAQGITNKTTFDGLGSSQPVADNSTAAGKAANRRVEIYITANAEMVKSAEAGTLK